MTAIFRAYNRLMVGSPLLTQCTTCGILVATGDVIAQKAIEKQQNLNWNRTLKFAAFGSFYVGPAISLWYRVLDKPLRLGAKQVMLKPWQKVATDQLLFAPNINLFALPILGAMNGKGWEEIKESIRDNYVDIMVASYKIWPAAQMVNFYFVPLNYRAVFASGFSLIWNTYFTWKLGEKQSLD